MADTDALRAAKFSTGLFLKDFPAKIRVLTTDPMVYMDKFGGTKYAFVVFNLNENKVQILSQGPGFASRFQEIHSDEDFGANIQTIDLKITTNGKSGIEVRYTIAPVGSPYSLSKEQLASIVNSNINLEEAIKKNSPNAVRLSEINAGKEVPQADEVEPEATQDVVIEDIDEPINLDGIPF